MKYPFKCFYCLNEFDFIKSIHAEFPNDVRCPECGREAGRIYQAAPVHYNAQGFHATDYDKHGDKLEKLNRKWSADMNEPPPPASTKVPKSAKEKY